MDMYCRFLWNAFWPLAWLSTERVADTKFSNNTLFLKCCIYAQCAWQEPYILNGWTITLVVKMPHYPRDKHIQRNSLWVRLITCGLTRVKNWLHNWTFTTKGYYPHNYQFKEAFLVKNSNPLLQQVMEHSTEYGFLGMESNVWRKNPLVSTFRPTFFST